MGWMSDSPRRVHTRAGVGNRPEVAREKSETNTNLKAH